MAKPGKFDAMITEAVTPASKCRTCHDPSRPVLVELLEAVLAKKAFQIGLGQVYEIFCKSEEGFGDRVRFDAFRNHLKRHEPLWSQIRKGSK